jgi:hypothetical protein
MKLLTTRTVTPGPRRLFEGSQVSPCFLWACYPDVSDVVRWQN